MTKKELEAAILQKAPELNQADVKMVTDLIFEKIKTNLSKGVETSVPNFGKFKIVEKSARVSRNPLTGEAIEVPQKIGVRFSNSKVVKEQLTQATTNKDELRA